MSSHFLLMKDEGLLLSFYSSSGLRRMRDFAKIVSSERQSRCSLTSTAFNLDPPTCKGEWWKDTGPQAQATDLTGSQSCPITGPCAQPRPSGTTCKLKPQWKHQSGKKTLLTKSSTSDLVEQWCLSYQLSGCTLARSLGGFLELSRKLMRQLLSGYLPRDWCTRPRNQEQRCSQKHVTHWECCVHQ